MHDFVTLRQSFGKYQFRVTDIGIQYQKFSFINIPTNFIRRGFQYWETAKLMVEEFVNAEFEGGRHQRRVDLITKIEQENSL